MSEIKLYKMIESDIVIAVSSDEFDWKTRFHDFGTSFQNKHKDFFEKVDYIDKCEILISDGDKDYETYIPEIRDNLFPSFTFSFITDSDQYESVSETLKHNNINYIYWENCEDTSELYWLVEDSHINKTIFSLIGVECANHIVFG